MQTIRADRVQTIWADRERWAGRSLCGGCRRRNRSAPIARPASSDLGSTSGPHRHTRHAHRYLAPICRAWSPGVYGGRADATGRSASGSDRASRAGWVGDTRHSATEVDGESVTRRPTPGSSWVAEYEIWWETGTSTARVIYEDRERRDSAVKRKCNVSSVCYVLISGNSQI